MTFQSNTSKESAVMPRASTTQRNGSRPIFLSAIYWNVWKKTKTFISQPEVWNVICFIEEWEKLQNEPEKKINLVEYDKVHSREQDRVYDRIVNDDRSSACQILGWRDPDHVADRFGCRSLVSDKRWHSWYNRWRADARQADRKRWGERQDHLCIACRYWTGRKGCRRHLRACPRKPFVSSGR